MLYSPNRKHNVRLLPSGEIRFGPPYYNLVLDDKTIPGRVFGKELCWSSDSQYLATEEWVTIDYQKGPITRVLLFDVVNLLASPFRTVNKGFASDFRFIEDSFVYKKRYYATGVINEVEVEISRIKNWTKVLSGMNVDDETV